MERPSRPGWVTRAYVVLKRLAPGYSTAAHAVTWKYTAQTGCQW